MKIVEISGGVLTMLPSTEYKFLKRLMDNNIKSYNISEINEKEELISDSLVSFNVLDKDGDYYYLKEVYL